MYRKSPQGILKYLGFFIADIVCFQMAFIIAYCLRHGITNPYGSPLYREIGLVGSIILVVVAYSVNTYRNVLVRGVYLEFSASLKQVSYTIVLLVFYLAAFKTAQEASRIVIWVTGLLYLILSDLYRMLWKKRVLKSGDSMHKRSLVIITTSSQSSLLQEHQTKDYSWHFRLASVCILDGEVPEEQHGAYRMISKEELVDYVCHEWVDEVLLDDTLGAEEIRFYTDVFTEMGVVVHRKLLQEEETIGRKQFVESIGSFTVLTTSVNVATNAQLMLKRFLDIVGGIIGCMITLIISIVLVPIIKLKDPGPAFFAQTRVGRSGRRFRIYKFRSMYLDAEERKRELLERNDLQNDYMFKMDCDPRIIGSKLLPDGTYKKGLGNRIREWSIDEFPQFYNVLKGEMSLVGTRPPTVDEWEKYQLHHRVRLAIKPGITGMWQISGRSDVKDFEDVVKLDSYYINNWNLGMDIKILLQTVKVVFGKVGSK